jgi:hypothetical protein
MAASISERPILSGEMDNSSSVKPSIKTLEAAAVPELNEPSEIGSASKVTAAKKAKRTAGADLAAKVDIKKGFLERFFGGFKLPWFRKKETVEAETAKSSADQIINLPTTKVFLPTDFDNIIAMKNEGKYKTNENFFNLLDEVDKDLLKLPGLRELFSGFIKTASVNGKELKLLENIAWQQIASDLYQGFAFEQNEKTGELEPKILNNRYISTVVTRNPYEMAQDKLKAIESPILDSLKPTLVSREQLGTKEEVKELGQYSPNKGRFSPINRSLYLLKNLVTKWSGTTSHIREFGFGAASLKPPNKWTPLLMPNSEFKTKDGQIINGPVPLLIDDTPKNNGGNKPGFGYQPEFLSRLQDPKEFIKMTFTSGIDKETGVFNPRKTNFYQKLVKEMILPLEDKGPEEFLETKRCGLKPEALNAIVEFKRKHENDVVTDTRSGTSRPLVSYQAVHNANQSGVYEKQFLKTVSKEQLYASGKA